MFAALHLVDLPVLAALKTQPVAWRQPCGVLALQEGAIVEKVKLPLLAVNDAARRTGIDAGWPLNRALVRCPALVVLPPQPEHEAALLAEMIAHAETLTPDLEIATPDTLVLDLSRATARQTGRLDWLEMADGGELRHVRAATPDLATLGVRSEDCHGGFVTQESLKPLPLALLGNLPGGIELLELLENWGLRTLGDLMGLPRQALAERLGPAAGEWHDLLHEKKRRLLRLHRPPESLAQELDLEHPLAESEPLVFALQRLLGPLSARLHARHVAARALHLGFHFEDGNALARTLRLPEPRTDALLDPIRLLLENLKLPAPVIRLTLDAETADPEAAQRDAFQRELPRPQQWQETLARLEALLGEGQVGIPDPPADHHADHFRLRHPDAAPAENDHWPSCPVPLRRFRPPHEVHVAFSPGPTPLAVLSGPHRGEILRLRGPFLHSGRWWDENDRWRQMEWDIQLATGIYRLVHLPPERWRMEGGYTW
ncbi:DNA polymerase Y family protein [Haloferula sargassicola]|uniref:DNA polymerase IV n=1 Tax=Haloferula sargassicola TaxID=490096 RepID=A0ABP9UNA4_9BACT